MISWKKISHKTITKHKLFELQLHKIKLPNKKIINDYFFIDANNGAIVVAITAENKIIFLEHYKYAVNDTIITLPGGLADSKKENIKAVALRELKEETGYTPKNIKFLGELMPLPSNITQRTYVYLATGCKRVTELDLDDTETLNVKLIKIEKLKKYLKSNKIKDSLTIAALFMAKNNLNI